ncbi:MAG: LPS assembly lipoprotein LptE [Flavobacteriales bacterium]|nr:LPS assembly lipoprotein LptE [Flavobacteriales bacterium]MCX7768724.1 LPS assembly lipoprotein LptE [Flavobacteriales bacterium]MDW8409884.1 LptE family protein [Flavobacteriales bacterium]
MRVAEGPLAVFLLVLILPAACKVRVTLSGQSIPPQASTVYVGFFSNKAPLANPAFSQILTEALRDKFIRETRLRLGDQNSDLRFEGAVIGYSVTPVAVQGNETLSQNRLTVTIQVSFVCVPDEKNNFQATFSRFADFDATQSLGVVEPQLMSVIVEQLTQDIFNKAFINW